MSPSLESFVPRGKSVGDMTGHEFVLSEGIRDYSLKEIEEDFPEYWWEKGGVAEVVKVLTKNRKLHLRSCAGVGAVGPSRRFLIRKFPIEADIFESLNRKADVQELDSTEE